MSTIWNDVVMVRFFNGESCVAVAIVGKLSVFLCFIDRLEG